MSIQGFRTEPHTAEGLEYWLAYLIISNVNSGLPYRTSHGRGAGILAGIFNYLNVNSGLPYRTSHGRGAGILAGIFNYLNVNSGLPYRTSHGRGAGILAGIFNYFKCQFRASVQNLTRQRGWNIGYHIIHND